MTTPLPCDAHGRIAATARSAIERLAASATCLACGPGVGRSTELVALLDWMWRSLPGTIVVDADGLNNLCDTRGGLDDPAGPRIITPHPGEFGRLVDDTALTREQAVALATQLAALNGIVVVLKGHQTVTTDGREQFVNATGNPGMATGGAGDVLTGLIAALVCQGLAPLRAARLAVHLHGLAGDLAAAELGQVSLIARDLVDYLPRAFARLPAEERPG